MIPAVVQLAAVVPVWLLLLYAMRDRRVRTVRPLFVRLSASVRRFEDGLRRAGISAREATAAFERFNAAFRDAASR